MTNLFRRATAVSLFLALGFLIVSCSKDDNPVTKAADPESAVQTFETSSGGKVTTPSGFAIEIIPGVIPPNQDNSSAKVTFSIELPVTLPIALPAGATQIGSAARFGPVGFSFRWPVRIYLNYPAGNEPGDLYVVRYEELLDSWSIVPVSAIDAGKRLIGVDVMQLGVYTLAKIVMTSKVSLPDSPGGFTWTGESGYYYALTVKAVSFKYSAQAPWYDLVGKVAGACGSGPTGGPLQPTHAILPQGTYEIWITRTKPGTLFELPKQYTWTIPATGTIDYPLTWTLGVASDWTVLSLPGGGEWREGAPGDWPQPTKPMGTGQFQATLNWVNTTSSAADLDLHLYGPDSMHVFWNNDRSTDGSVELDLDWMSGAGNAAENIYSLKSMPKGNYEVKVHNFGGVTKSFNVRIIRSGSVKSYTGSLTNQQLTSITTFTIN
jgi:hypothetical protein